MPAEYSIESICRRYRNEDVHTEYVTALALQIFDAVHGWLGLSAGHRRILETAGRLHDIGFGRNPLDHVRVGAKIIQGQKLTGMTRAQMQAIAATMLLHSRRWELYLDHPAFRRVGEKVPVRKLGAILRLADALDHGHIQNASVVAIERHGRKVALRVASPGYEANVQQARAKADLWHRVTRLELDIRRVKTAKSATPYGDILTPSLSGLEAARRLLFYYYRSVSSHGKLALVEDDPIHLHDIRVGIRRFRSVLRLFRAELAGTGAESLNTLLRDINRRLGPLRDEDVWLAFLQSNRVRKRASHDSHWEAYMARHRRQLERNLRRLRAILGSAPFEDAVIRMAMLLRTDIPDLLRRSERVRPAGRAVAGKLKRTLRRISQHETFRKNMPSESMHELRILSRRGRYWAEFSAPLLGAPVTLLARRLEAVADAFGHQHDLDVAISQLVDDDLAPRAVRGLLRADRQVALRQSAAAWSQLRKRKLLERTRRAIG